MFAGKHVHVTAVRRKDQQITFLEVPKKPTPVLNKIKKIPFVRGIVGIVESAAKGSQHLTYSAEAYAEDEAGPEEAAKQKEQEKEKDRWNLTMILGVAVVGILSFVVGKLIFTLVPAFVEGLIFSQAFENKIMHNLLEGVIKIILLLVYLWFISQTPMIKRLFQYHGAEHKVISAYEAGSELTVEKVQKFSRLHYRCGSSFIIFTVIVGVIIYSFFTWDSMAERIMQRILLLPVVLGVSYEVLRWTNALRDIPVLKWLGAPGLWLQLLTTKEPNDDQVAVSIASFNRMRELDNEISTPRVALAKQA
jgi:Predicted metal-dependent enzyme